MIRSRIAVLFVAVAAAAGITSTPGVHGAGPAPIKIGSQIAGSFADATGHSRQSHLVYAANAGVWWLFTLTSAADSPGGSNHVIKAYRSSGSDLATAVWTAAADSPGASASGGGAYAPSAFMGSGRALGVVYVNNAPTDVVHAEVAMAADGQDGVQGHIRARLTATGITWESWNYHVEGAATWTTPRAVALGLSTGKYIHSGGPILQQEVDANARRSNSPDTGATWASTGFSSVAVIDNSMINASNAIAFAPLANDSMLAVYDNGGGISTCYNCGQTGAPEPNLTNLGFKRSNANGSWPVVPVGSQAPGDGQVFSTSATIDQNDWTLVPVDIATIRAYRRNAGGTGIEARAYNTGTNTWSTAPAPPPFGSGQAFKHGAGLFGAHDASSTWLFVVNTDAANSILYSRYDGTAWTQWAAVPGTDSGTHVRRFISGAPVVAAGQIGLIWTEGSNPYDVFTTSLALTTAVDVTPPDVSLIQPADGSTVFGEITIKANATDDRGVSSVQFKLDGANLGQPQIAPPYQLTWNSRTVGNGTHEIAATATDAAGNSATARALVSVANGPLISAVGASSITDSSAVIGWTTDVDATSRVDFGTTTAYGRIADDSALVRAHQVTLAPLNPGTTYHYQVTSADAGGNGTVTSGYTFTTTGAGADTTLPTVSFTAPASGAVVSGTSVTVSASASDNVGVAGVQFELDGVDLGAEDTASPYEISWNTTTTTNGSHTLTAVARDAAGNTRSASRTVTVNNSTPDTTRPTVSVTAPAANATGVSRATTVRATFSEAMNASTVTAITFVLRDGTTTVAAAVSYDSGTLAATLTPSQQLAAGRIYTATITGGSGGVKDLAGNALASNYVWSFTTASAAGAITIWSPSAVPARFETSDTNSVELGLRFRSDVAGLVTGVRFYKGTTTTGTHTGTLWSNSGTQLATATFTNETASGWQQVDFATPVAIAAKTIYVVSYHTNVGRYAVSDAYFASAGAHNAPLHAPRSGNGVYRYGGVAFPNSTYNSANYWVDVVFVPQ
jgi:hypothetical protein